LRTGCGDRRYHRLPGDVGVVPISDPFPGADPDRVVGRNVDLRESVVGQQVRARVRDGRGPGRLEQLEAAAGRVADDETTRGQRLGDGQPEAFRDAQRDEDRREPECVRDLFLGET
jgi:hypothetical protein